MDYVTGLLISMDWNGTSHDSNGIACSTNWKGTSYDLILAVVDGLMKMVHYKPVQISRCTQAGGDNFSRCNLIPRSPRLSDRDSVFTCKFWSPQYHFWARLRLPLTRLLQEHRIGILWLHAEKTFCTDLVNLFLSDLWGYMHRFGYKLGIKSNFQHIIKARSLEATLPAIILICDIFRVSLLEHDH